ncbi:stage II sporulation protein M [Halovivax cerinus]|uniref:Stage II sporulation protein M n=1 Tax=Halovivax cerinus TaxID=1487865 RepID=A0ABD5NR38_9EURY|nr:stage II sporulation protein M [Halovivax cerinus]
MNDRSGSDEASGSTATRDPTSEPPANEPNPATAESDRTTTGESDRTTTGESEPTTTDDADPETVRRWAILCGLLGVATLLVALATGVQGPIGEAIGAAVLGCAFVGVAVLGPRRAPGALQALANGWAEHRRYTGGAAGLFFLGVAGGLALGATGVNLLQLITEVTGQDPFAGIEESDLTAWWFVQNNTIPFLVSIAGAVSLGLLSAYVIGFNGLLVGNVVWFTGGLVGVDYILVGLLPHGIFELTALFVAAGVGFRIVHRLVARITGRREAFVTRAYLRRTAALVVFAWFLLVLAAFVETYVTSPLLETVFAERLEGLETA